MGIRLRLKDGIDVDADSPEELARFYQELGRTANGNGTPKADKIAAIVSAAPKTDEAIPSFAEQLLCALYPHADGLETAKIAKELNVGLKAVGGYVTSLTRWAQRNQLGSKKQLLTKDRRVEDGKKVRTIKITTYFRKMIDEGKVRGFHGS